MTFVVPKFKLVFDGLLNGAALPAFTTFVFNISDALKTHLLVAGLVLGSVVVAFLLSLKTKAGRWGFDKFKLAFPLFGPLFRKAAISRFARTLGTLISSGVPILQALSIVKETAGNVLIGKVIFKVHENVKQGEPMAPTLKAAPLFPAMVAGMVDV